MKKFEFITFILLLNIITVSCAQDKNQEKDLPTATIDKIQDTSCWSGVTTEAYHYKTSKFDIAIFPEKYQGFYTFKNRFTPTKEEINRAEESLQIGLSKLNHQEINQSSAPIIHENLDKYKRQYFGYVNEKGEKILFINCFWDDNEFSDGSWLNGEVMVLDGGSYFWQVKYNLSTNKLFDLEVNGNA